MFHGTPGSRLSGNILADAATVEGIRLVAPERPGYGLSTSYPAPLLAIPDDVAVLADKLGIERFVSGGGYVAMACAFKLANRVTATGLVGSLMPMSVRYGSDQPVNLPTSPASSRSGGGNREIHDASESLLLGNKETPGAWDVSHHCHES